MTRSRILRMELFVFLMIFLIAQVDICDSTFRERRDNKIQSPLDQSNKSLSNITDAQVLPKKNISAKVLASDNQVPETKKTVENDITSKPGGNLASATVPNSSGSSEIGPPHLGSLNAGSLKRGFYVLIGLSVLVIAYFVFRSFRVGKTRAQMIRKYGILAHRQDVEMRPLPLDEDDDDDTTVFDASNMSTHSILHTSP